MKFAPRSFLAVAGAAALAAATIGAAEARDRIRIVGSSTVFPFSTVVAENFGKSSGMKTPVVESTGSGGGLKLFCAGVGAEHPDIANASRRIERSEIDYCAGNGVSEIVEIKVGYDGIVLANSKRGAAMSVTERQIFQALAARVPVDGEIVANPYNKWSEIDPSLPDVEIEVLGPPPTSGTRDAFVELAMRDGARSFPVLRRLREDEGKAAFRAVSDSMREDGRFVEAGENDNLIVQKLEANPAAFGIFGFGFLDQNADKVRGSTVGGVAPTFENIAAGDYGISRSLYFYAKKAHVGTIPGIAGYIAEFTGERAAGEEGYLADKGLIPLSAAELAKYRDDGANLTPLAGL